MDHQRNVLWKLSLFSKTETFILRLFHLKSLGELAQWKRKRWCYYRPFLVENNTSLVKKQYMRTVQVECGTFYVNTVLQAGHASPCREHDFVQKLSILCIPNYERAKTDRRSLLSTWTVLNSEGKWKWHENDIRS